MTVRDYVNDMVLDQPFFIEVNHYDKNNDWVGVDTFEFKIPHKKCVWLDHEVKYFRAFGKGITLCIDSDK